MQKCNPLLCFKTICIYERPLHKLTLWNWFTTSLASLLIVLFVKNVFRFYVCTIFVQIFVKYCTSQFPSSLYSCCRLTNSTSPMLKLLFAILKNYRVVISKYVSSSNQVDDGNRFDAVLYVLPFCTILRQSKLHKINGS